MARLQPMVIKRVLWRRDKAYLKAAVSRKRNPLRDTVSVEGALSKWFYPAIGDLPLSQVDNLTLKPIVEKTSASLSPRAVNKYVEYAKQVVKSLKGPNGEPVFNRSWDADTMDLPVVVHFGTEATIASGRRNLKTHRGEQRSGASLICSPRSYGPEGF